MNVVQSLNDDRERMVMATGLNSSAMEPGSLQVFSVCNMVPLHIQIKIV